MKTDRELLEQALALVELGGGSDKEAIMQSIRARLAEDDDEPVGYLYDIDMYGDHEPLRDCIDSEIDPNIPKIRLKNIRPLYTRPAPARKPMSEDEIEKEFDRRCELDCCPDFSEAVRWAEKAHGIGEEE